MTPERKLIHDKEHEQKMKELQKRVDSVLKDKPAAADYADKFIEQWKKAGFLIPMLVDSRTENGVLKGKCPRCSKEVTKQDWCPHCHQALLWISWE